MSDAQAPRRGLGNATVWEVHRKVGHAIGRERQRAVNQSDLVEHLEGRGMDRVAAEVAVERPVCLEEADLDALAGEQQAQDKARRSAADNAAIDSQNIRGGSCHAAHPGPSMAFGHEQDYPT